MRGLTEYLGKCQQRKKNRTYINKIRDNIQVNDKNVSDEKSGKVCFSGGTGKKKKINKSDPRMISRILHVH